VLKLAPLIKAAEESPAPVRIDLCLSGQHAGLEETTCRELGLVPRAALPPSPGPLPLASSLALLTEGLAGLLGRLRPAAVVVQGDTTTTLAGALAAFYGALPVFHVEAGLRTTDPLRPFPEEMHRRLLSRLATLHFAPTEGARDNLVREGVPAASILVTGNTIVDALHAFGLGAHGQAAPGPGTGTPSRSTLLVTLHRRENLEAAPDIARAVLDLAERADVEVVWVRHGNATSAAALHRVGPSVRVVDPLPYAAFIGLMSRARLVLTDSGGVQEEAPVLGVPVVVLRGETDRPEAVTHGNAIVAGLARKDIVRACAAILDREEVGPRTSSPFGDGRAAPRILEAITRHLAP
jgi:UDP-N-acetylglucosamine 2-epimerase (non-hydrolysing)